MIYQIVLPTVTCCTQFGIQNTCPVSAPGVHDKVLDTNDMAVGVGGAASAYLFTTMACASPLCAPANSGAPKLATASSTPTPIATHPPAGNAACQPMMIDHYPTPSSAPTQLPPLSTAGIQRIHYTKAHLPYR